MRAAVSAWGAELSFLRTTVGKEFDVSKSLSVKTGNERTQFYGTYGYFDLAGICAITSLSHASIQPVHSGVLESASFRYVAYRNGLGQEAFEEALAKWLTAIAVLIKIHPLAEACCGLDIRWRAAKYMTERFPDAWAFIGFGYSELMILRGGDSLPDLLDSVTELRTDARLGATVGTPKGASPSTPLFLKTTTYPLISVDRVHRPRNYAALRGDVEPFVTVTCEPACEGHVLKDLARDISVKNVYGKSDLLLYWDRQIEFSAFCGILTKLRRKWLRLGSIAKTTTYLERERKASVGQPAPIQLRARTKHRVLAPRRIDEIRDPHLRSMVAELCLRLRACLQEEHLRLQYSDMENTLRYLPDIVRILANTSSSPEDVRNAEFELIQTADLARAAIAQRYAGLESHPETLTHSPSPLLCDIGAIVSAAACIPRYVFGNLMSEVSASRTWSGFLVFGGTYSPLRSYQDILALPASAAFRPVDDWWKLTHEIAHAIFDILEVDDRVPILIKSFLEEAMHQYVDDLNRFLSELFANWFDSRYFFSGEIDFFLRSIWQSWLQYPSVWEDRTQYLLRSFAVFLCQDLDGLLASRRGSVSNHAKPYLQTKWQEFVGIIGSVDGMQTLLQDNDDALLDEIFLAIEGIQPVLHFFDRSFEQVCGVKGLWRRLNPKYPGLAAHVKSIQRGQVVFAPIRNPCALLVEMAKRQRRDTGGLRSDAALILSLGNANRQLMANGE